MMNKELKVKKRYADIIDRMLKNGHTETKSYGDTAYLMRVAKKTKALKVQPLYSNTFLIIPTNKKLSKNKKKSLGGRYCFYNLE